MRRSDGCDDDVLITCGLCGLVGREERVCGDDEAGVSCHAGAVHGGGAVLYAVAERGEARHGEQAGLAACQRARLCALNLAASAVLLPPPPLPSLCCELLPYCLACARARVGMSDCVFPANSAPESCADVQALFEGTYDSQLSRVGCGLDCRSADDVAALQTVFRSIKVCAPTWLSAPAPLSVPLTLRTLSRRWGTNASTWRRAPPPAMPRPTAATLALAPTPTR